MPKIEKINMKGAGLLMGDSLTGESLTLVQGGAGKIELHDLTFQALDAVLGGLGEILLTGHVETQKVNLAVQVGIRLRNYSLRMQKCCYPGLVPPPSGRKRR